MLTLHEGSEDSPQIAKQSNSHNNKVFINNIIIILNIYSII